MAQLNYNLLSRWAVGLSSGDAAWDTTTCTKNRERLQHKEITPLLSDKHLSVDGTLIEACPATNASCRRTMKTVAGRTSTIRKNSTYESTTDSDSCPYRKSEG